MASDGETACCRQKIRSQQMREGSGRKTGARQVRKGIERPLTQNPNLLLTSPNPQRRQLDTFALLPSGQRPPANPRQPHPASVIDLVPWSSRSSLKDKQFHKILKSSSSANIPFQQGLTVHYCMPIVFSFVSADVHLRGKSTATRYSTVKTTSFTVNSESCNGPSHV